jgi:hypothetical protein
MAVCGDSSGSYTSGAASARRPTADAYALGRPRSALPTRASETLSARSRDGNSLMLQAMLGCERMRRVLPAGRRRPAIDRSPLPFDERSCRLRAVARCSPRSSSHACSAATGYVPQRAAGRRGRPRCGRSMPETLRCRADSASTQSPGDSTFQPPSPWTTPVACVSWSRGTSYGEVFATPRLLRLDGDAAITIAVGEHAPWTGVRHPRRSPRVRGCPSAPGELTAVATLRRARSPERTTSAAAPKVPCP